VPKCLRPVEHLAGNGRARTVPHMATIKERKRTWNGHQPTIGGDAYAVVTTATILAAHLSCCREVATRETLKDVVLPALTRCINTELREHLANTAGTYVAARANAREMGLELTDAYATHQLSCPRADQSWELSHNIVYQDVLELVSQPVGRLDVDSVVTDLTAQGYDAEEVVSAVIIRETHAHTGLLYKEISKLRTSLPDMGSADLLGFAWRGLRVALRQYDPRLGFSFSTYACPKINGAIRDGVRSESHLPKRLTTLVRKVSAANEHLTKELSRTPTLTDICEYLDTSTASLSPRLNAPASLDELRENTEKERVVTNLVDNNDPADAACSLVRDAHVSDALEHLDPDAQLVMRALFYDERTLTSVADELRIDVRGVRAIRDESLTLLRGELQTWSVSN
jgi:RNA polymerase sigma factor for flagellar operon FliA